MTDPAPGCRHHARCGGFTLLELTVSLLLASLLLYAVHTSLQTSIRGRRAAEQNHRTFQIALDLLDRLREIPFGSPTDPAPTSLQLTELFDDDNVTGTITLSQLRVAPTAPGYSFDVAANNVVGTFEVHVSDDLDGDGANTGPREGRPDLFRLAILFNGRLQIATLRAAEPDFTVKD